MPSVNRGSAYLRNILDTEGREPTIEESNYAAKMVRDDARARGVPLQPDEELKGTLAYPYQNPEGGATTAYGRSIIRSVQGTNELFPEGEVGPIQLFQTEGGRRLFEESVNFIPSGFDYETAIIEVGVLNTPERLEAYAQDSAKGMPNHRYPKVDTVGNELLKHFRDMQVDGKFREDIMIMSDEDFAALDSPEARANYLQQLMMVTDMRDAQIRMFLGMEFVKNYSPDLTSAHLNEVEQELPFRYKEAIAQNIMQNAYDQIDKEFRRVMAQQRHDNNIEAVMDIVVQDFFPLANVGTKMTFLNMIMNIMEVPPELRPRTRNIGDSRQAIRNWIDEIGPQQTATYMIELRKKIEELQSDPAMSKIVREWLVVEQFENIFTPELMSGGTPVNNFDKWAGRIETGVEVLVMAFLLKGATKGLSRAFSGGDVALIKKLADGTANRAAQTEFNRIVQGTMARQLEVDPGEAALNLLPRPSQLVDERTVNLPGVEDALNRANTISSVIMDASRGNLADVLTDAQKAAIRQETRNRLQLGDHARIAPAMSTEEVLEDGILINAVITKNGESAYKNFDELFGDLIWLDPELDKLKILRRGDDGRIHEVKVKGPVELERVYNTRNLDQLPDEALAAKMDEAVQGGYEWEAMIIEREGARRAGEKSVSGILDDEYFLQYTHFRPWHPLDKIAFGADTIRHTSIPLDALAPNMKFGDDLYGAVQAATNADARINRLYNDLYLPYYKLNSKSKQRVSQVFAWAEEEAQRIGDDIPLYDILTEFPDLTRKEIEGIVSVRVGMDSQLAVLNRRVWREYKALDYRTAKPKGADGEVYHGKILEGDELTPGPVYDPVSGDIVQLTAKQAKQLDGTNIKIMKLPEAMDIPGTGGAHRYTRVIVSPETHDVGALADDILPRYPGYRYRFYEDPWMLVKRQGNSVIDGVRQAAVVETAFRTAGSRLEADNFLNRAFIKTTDRDGKTIWIDEDGYEYDAIPARSLSATDAALKERQVLRWEGRLFFDERNRTALKSVNGNPAEIMDFTKALERGTSLSTRMNTHEDVLRSLRQALYGEYKLPELENVHIAHKDINIIIKDLNDGLLDATGDLALQKRYREAISVAKYIRAQEGMDVDIRWFRGQVMRAALWVDRMASNLGFKPGKMSSVEKWALKADPLKAMRSTAFGAFMVLRPGRQLVLQMMQPLFLTGIDPAYVLTGKGFLDSILLRTAFSQLRNVDYIPDGMSIATRAKLMGLSKKELIRLVDKLDKSGTIDVVDMHSFSGGTRRWQQLQPHDGSVGSRIGYGLKYAGSRVFNTLKSVGFDLGEEVNKLGTFMIATRRVMKNKQYKSVLNLTDEDWKVVYRDTEQLSFAMTKAGSFGYQSGWKSVPTQFLAFTHKAMLTVLGQNPAIQGKNLVKVWGGLLALYGADMFGARTITKEALYSMGFDDTWMNQEIIPESGATALDLISGGMIQTIVNGIGNITTEDWVNLSTNTVGPVVNVTQFMELFVEGIFEAPIGTVFGPFGNRFNAFLEAADFANHMMVGYDGNIIDKAAIMADLAAKKLLPQYSDLSLAYLHWKHGQLMTNNGTIQQIEPSLMNIFARATVGMRTLEEEADFRRRELEWEDDDLKRDAISAGRAAVLKYINLYRTNEISPETFKDLARMIGHIAQMYPEHLQEEIIKGIMLPKLGEEPVGASPVEQLIDTVINKHSLSAAEAKALLSEMTATPEQRQRLNEWVDNVYKPLEQNSAKMTEDLIRYNER